MEIPNKKPESNWNDVCAQVRLLLKRLKENPLKMRVLGRAILFLPRLFLLICVVLCGAVFLPRLRFRR